MVRTSARPHTMNKKHIAVLIKVAVSAALLSVLYSRVDLAGLARLLANMRVWLLLPVAVILFFNTWVSAAKWRLLLRADDIHIPQSSLVASYLIATFFNVFLPSNVGGDFYRIYDVGRSTAKPINTFASVFADRLSGFLALALLGLVFSTAGLSLIGDPRVLAAPLVLFAALVTIVVLLVQQRLLRRILVLTRLDRIGPIARINEGVMAALTAYRTRPGVLRWIMGISFVFQIGVIVCVWLLATALRIDMPFFAFCVFVPLISILEALPVSIYGLGLRDAGYVFFLTRLGHPDEQGLSLALLYVIVTLIYSSVGGILFALRTRRAAPRPQPAPETDG